MSAVMTGQAMGGIFPAIVNIVVVSVNIHEKYVGFFCFLVASAFLLACLALFIMVNTNPLYRYYAESQATPQAPTRDYEGMQNQPALEGEERSSVFLIFSKPLMYHGSVFLIFCITLSVFPAITVLVQSQYSGTTWGQVYFTPVTCFLLFNVGDFVGRWLANYFQTPSKSTRGQRIVLILSIVRTVFIPLFLFCNASPTKRELPVLFHSDMVYILLMSALALSNGYLGNICMIHGPKVWEDSQNQEATAMMLVAFLVLGTSIGSVFSNVLVKCV